MLKNAVTILLLVYSTQLHGRKQGHYTISVDRLEITFKNESLINVGADTNFYNRTYKLFSAWIYHLVNLNLKTSVHMDYYTFQGNMYKLTVIQIKKPLHEVLKFQYFDITGIAAKTVPLFKWPIERMVKFSWGHFKLTLYISNLILLYIFVDFSGQLLPNRLPSGFYKVSNEFA